MLYYLNFVENAKNIEMSQAFFEINSQIAIHKVSVK